MKEDYYGDAFLKLLTAFVRYPIRLRLWLKYADKRRITQRVVISLPAPTVGKLLFNQNRNRPSQFAVFTKGGQLGGRWWELKAE